MTTYRIIPGSERAEFTQAERRDAVPGNTLIKVTVVLSLDSTDKHARNLALLAAGHGLTCLQRHPLPHAIHLVGRAKAIQQAFQTELSRHEGQQETFRCRKGPYSVPSSFGKNVVAVLGLDTRPQARTYYHTREYDPKTGTPSFTPVDIAAIYGFPAGDGTGHSVGIIELGGAYQSNAMKWDFGHEGIGIQPHVTATGKQHAGGASVEVMLDAEIIASIVPSARTMVYFRPNTTAGFYNAVAAAVNAGHDAVSISWGAEESQWTTASMNALNNLAHAAGLAGVTITAASGDSGSSDGGRGSNVDFPASAPNILGCGGTSLIVTGSSYGSETVWNGNGGATGGGFSAAFPIPDYQSSVNIGGNTQRMVPDVASVADPGTGYLIRVNGKSMVVGGTSAAAPLWAALICRLNQALGQKMGFINPALYALPHLSLRPIVNGSNGAYSAHGDGSYSPTCGLGSPPANLASLLSGGHVLAEPATATGTIKVTVNWSHISPLPRNAKYQIDVAGHTSAWIAHAKAWTLRNVTPGSYSLLANFNKITTGMTYSPDPVVVTSGHTTHVIVTPTR